MGNYLGRGLDKISNIEVLDNITFDGSSSYSITKDSVAFTPNSAQSCLISIDGVVQATNFTVSSSTIDFGVAIPSTSVCNFFLHYGTGVMTVPSDGSVTTAKLGDNAVTTAKLGDGSVTSAKLSSGKVLQVVQGTHATPVSNSTSTYADTGLTASITPISTSNKILVLVNQSYLIQNTTASQAGGSIRLLRDTTRISGGIERYELYLRAVGSNNRSAYGRQTINFLDTPSSTSALTYKTQLARYVSGDSISTSPSSMEASIILMEVSA